VIEGPPEVPIPDGYPVSDIPILFPIGALTPRSVKSLSESLKSLLANDTSPTALSQAAVHSRRARQHPWRTYFIFSPHSDHPPKVAAPVMAPSTPPPVIFVFTGQGPQHISMGRRLFHAYHVFRQTVLEMDVIYQSLVGVSLMESTGLFQGSTSKVPEGIWSAEITLPAMTIVQIALYDLLLSIGVKPHALIGHSAGETALVYASGAGSKAMALELAIARARSIKSVESAENGMAALGCGLNAAVGLIERTKQRGDGVLEIGAVNSPDAVLITGSGNLLNHLVDVAKADGIFARRVQSMVPSHSSLMDLCRKQYLEGVSAVFSRHNGLHRPITKTYSTVAGQPRITTRFTPEYFWDNLRNPVHFYQGTTSVLDDFPGALFVEISPHPALSSYIASSVGHNRVLCPMRRPKTQSDVDAEVLAFTRTIGDLILLGVNEIDLTTLYGRPSRDLAYDIPYPFAERYFPMRIDGPRLRPEAPLDGSSLRLQINSKTHPDLAQHVINGEPIMPGAGFLDMVSETRSRSLYAITRYLVSRFAFGFTL
jgi:acyl transferase domain-containing protein